MNVFPIKDRQAQILQNLKRTPQQAKEIAAALNLPLPTVYRNLLALEAKGLVQKDKKTWALTDKGRQLLEICG